jgi:hypothetical protein
MKIAPYLHLLWVLLVLSCTRTEYKPFDENDKSSVDLSRTVNFYLNPAFKDNPPNCVVVFQPSSIGNTEFVGRIEKVLIRHLSDKFPTVIGGKLRDVRAASYAFDFTVPNDRRDFAKSIKCGSFLEFHVFRPKHTYLVFWSELKLGLEARLFHQRDGTELWKARHVASRSDGGLSFSPFGLAVNAYEANVFASDGDVIESVSEDLVRRVIASLPNTLSR